MPIKLVVFDVDGTLLRGDTVCQVIARGLGKYERMCELERSRNTEQVIAAREEMADWYRQAGREKVESLLGGLALAPGAEEGIDMLRDAGVTVALASITWSFAVQHLAQRFSISHIAASVLDFDSGRIDHAWGDSKAEFLRAFKDMHGLDTEMTAAVGDTSTDYEMLRAAGLGIFVGRHVPDLSEVLHMPDADIRHVAAAILEH